MKKFSHIAGRLLVALVATLVAYSCNPEPQPTDLEFSYPTFDCDEESERDYISVYLMYSPEKFPVVVTIEVEMTGGIDYSGRELALKDVIKFDETDQTYSVRETGDRTAIIENVEVTYTDYNKKIYFSTPDIPGLQQETVKIVFRLKEVDGSAIGSVDETTLTIVDDEKAPLIKVGYYDTTYTSPAEAERQEKGQFYLRLQKVDKYKYVASEFFGLSRPRLLGTYDPEECTLSFDGTDYDHELWEVKEPINAFENDTIWGYDYNHNGIITKVLRMRGSGASGKEPIVFKTEKIDENTTGVLLEIESACGFDILDYTTARPVVGVYDAMEHSSSMLFSKTNYDEEEEATRTNIQQHSTPIPFGSWRIEE